MVGGRWQVAVGLDFISGFSKSRPLQSWFANSRIIGVAVTYLLSPVTPAWARWCESLIFSRAKANKGNERGACATARSPHKQHDPAIRVATATAFVGRRLLRRGRWPPGPMGRLGEFARPLPVFHGRIWCRVSLSVDPMWVRAVSGYHRTVSIV